MKRLLGKLFILLILGLMGFALKEIPTAVDSSILVAIGFVILAAYTLSEIGSTTFSLPRVTGYIAAGVALGPFALQILSKEVVEELKWSGKFRAFLKFVMIYGILPGLGISAILFYAAGNPIVGNPDVLSRTDASYSWWVLFGVRQILMLCLAKLTEIVIIEILTLHRLTTSPLAEVF